MRVSVVLAALVACVSAGALEQPTSITGWPAQPSSGNWPGKAALDDQIPPEPRRGVSGFKQDFGGKGGLSLTVSGPSHIVQTVHKVRTIDQGGKILYKARAANIGNEKYDSMFMDQLPVIQRSLGSPGVLSFETNPHFLKYPLTSVAHEHIVSPTLQKEILASRFYEVSSAPQVRRHMQSGPTVLKLAVVNQVPRVNLMHQFSKSPVLFPKVSIIPQFLRPAVLHPRVPSNPVVVTHAKGVSPLPETHNHVVLPAHHRNDAVAAAYPEVPSLFGYPARALQSRVAVPHGHNRLTIHHLHKQALVSKPHNYVQESRFHDLKWH